MVGLVVDKRKAAVGILEEAVDDALDEDELAGELGFELFIGGEIGGGESDIEAVLATDAG